MMNTHAQHITGADRRYGLLMARIHLALLILTALSIGTLGTAAIPQLAGFAAIVIGGRLIHTRDGRGWFAILAGIIALLIIKPFITGALMSLSVLTSVFMFTLLPIFIAGFFGLLLIVLYIRGIIMALLYFNRLRRNTLTSPAPQTTNPMPNNG